MFDEGIEKQQLECKRRKQQKVLLRWRGEGVLGFGDPKAKNVTRENGKRLGGLDIILSTWSTLDEVRFATFSSPKARSEREPTT
jgi:hypothetical protein